MVKFVTFFAFCIFYSAVRCQSITAQKMINLLNSSVEEFQDYAALKGYKFKGIENEKDYYIINYLDNYNERGLRRYADRDGVKDAALFPFASVEFDCNNLSDYLRLKQEVIQLGFKFLNNEQSYENEEHSNTLMFYKYAKDNMQFDFGQGTQSDEGYLTYMICLHRLSKLQLQIDELNKHDPSVSSNSITGVIRMIKSEGGTYEVPVTINGVLKISFILDSGASDVSISPDVALTLIKTGTVKESDFIGTQSYSFADGSHATSKVFIIHEIKIGNKIITNVKASISNSIDAPMLLGQTVLQRFGKFTVDNTNHILTLY